MHQALKPMAAAVFKPLVKHSGPSVSFLFQNRTKWSEHLHRSKKQT